MKNSAPVGPLTASVGGQRGEEGEGEREEERGEERRPRP